MAFPIRMSTPRVSVLIPTYRYAGYLRETLDSVLSQDFTDFEVLVSDDCSGDGTAEILAEYAARDARVRAHVHPKNVGMVQNWNWCLRDSRGEYVKYVFGDDLLARPDALGKMVAMLDAHPDAALAASARNVIDEHSRVTEVWSPLGESGLYPGSETAWQCLASSRNLVGEPTAVMFRRGAGARGFSERYDQLVDLEMWCHLLCQGSLIYSAEALCSFRRHPLQRTEFNRERGMHNIELLRLVRDYWNHPILAGRSVRAYMFRILYRTRKRAASEPALAAEREHVMRILGRGEYAARWLWKKVTNPFVAVVRSAMKQRAGGRK
jgi:glycosyltransferase involved in cell wall biosynthesis